jgi:transposase
VAETIIENKACTKVDQWRGRIAEQERSGLSIKQFCKERGLTAWSFYDWRKRLRESGAPIRFALVERRSESETCYQRRCRNRIRRRRAIAHPVRSRRRDVTYGDRGIARMIHLPASVRVYLCLSPTDMRRSFDGLHALVRDHLQLDAFAGHLYLFANRGRDRLKILYWDRDGFAVWAKRLEAGSFAIPVGEPGSSQIEITTEELGAVLSGIDMEQVTRRKRYRRGGA